MINFIKNNWLTISIILLILIVVYSYYKSKKEEVKINENKNSSLNQYNQGSSQQLQNTQSSKNQNLSKYKAGDRVYSNEDNVSSYKTKTIGPSNIFKSYKKDEYIGNFISSENNLIQVTTTNGSNITYVWLLSNRVYNKI